MAPWLRFLEAWMVQQLLRTPAFHRAVQKVAKNVHRVRHGPNPEEMGGTKIDNPENASFVKHFIDEVKGQLGQTESQAAKAIEQEAKTINTTGRSRAHAHDRAAEQEQNADTVWQEASKNVSEPPKQGIMGEYMDALRDQVRGGKPPR